MSTSVYLQKTCGRTSTGTLCLFLLEVDQKVFFKPEAAMQIGGWTGDWKLCSEAERKAVSAIFSFI